MEEPNLYVPQPSPHPSSLLREDDLSLELTPERPPKGKSRLNKQAQKQRAAKPTSAVKFHSTVEETGLIDVHPVSQLSMPQLNSTAHLYHKLNTLKHQQRPKVKKKSDSIMSSEGGRKDNEQGPTHENHQSSSVMSSKMAIADLEDLEEIITHKPLKEVNVPRHTSRYSDLVPVDISEESFQQLTVKPRTKKSVPRLAKQEGPDIMEFFTSDLEWEEAEWNGDVTREEPVLQPAEVPWDAPLTLYNVMQS